MRCCFQFFFWNPFNGVINLKKAGPVKKFFLSLTFWLEVWDGQFRKDSCLAVAYFLPFLQLFDCQNEESFLESMHSFKALFRQKILFWCKYYSTWSNFQFWATSFLTRLSDQLGLCRGEHFEEIYFFQKKTKIFSFLEEVFQLSWDKVWTSSKKIFGTVL